MPFPWQGTVGWALGRVSAHKRSVCRVSEANRTLPQTSVQQTLHQISYSFRCKQHANCRGEITPTAVVYIVHTLYIHVWILPLSAKLVHIELLLTHKLATVNLWLLIAAYEQSLICYRTRCKHSCIPCAYPRKHLLIPCPTNTIVGHILAIVSNKRALAFPWPRRELVWSASDKRAPCERSEPNIQSNKSANRCKD